MMTRHVIGVLLAIALAAGLQAREFLTEKEIELIQDAQEIDKRTRVYLDAAELRLKAADERLAGKEPEVGDPLEFFTAEDLIDAYCRIIDSVMHNLDETYRTSRKRIADPEKIRRALKALKGSAERNESELEILKRLAEEKQKEELWRLVNKAIEMTQGAREGAEYVLSQKLASPSSKKSPR